MKDNIKVVFKDGAVTIYQNDKIIKTDMLNAFEVNLSSDSPITSEVSGLLDSSLETYMPEKGESIFVIDDEYSIQEAYDILKEHVGDFEFNYCPTNFISVDMDADYEYYGKFDIEDLEGLYKKLFDNGIVVKKAKFIPQSFDY